MKNGSVMLVKKRMELGFIELPVLKQIRHKNGDGQCCWKLLLETGQMLCLLVDKSYELHGELN